MTRVVLLYVMVAVALCAVSCSRSHNETIT